MGEDRVHLYIVVTLLSEDIHNLTDRTLVFSIRPFYDSYHRLVVGLSALHLSSRNDDVVGEYIAWCNKVSQILIHFQSTNEGIFCTFQDLVYLCFLDVVLSACEESEFHAVAIERSHRVALRNEDRILFAVRNDGVLAICLSNKLTLHHLHALVQAIRIITYLCQIVIPCHFLHDVDSQHLERMRGEMERTEYFFKAERFARPFGKELLQNLCELRLVHSFAAFFTFSHNYDCYMTVYSFIRQRNKKNRRIQSFLASFFVFY